MESVFDIAIDVLADATKDTLYLVPFLLVVYLIMEWLEHKAGEATQRAVRRAGAAGPLVGAVLGAFPQCGFSAMGATLYAGRVVSLGTLFAVFLSTSDELLPMMIAEHAPIEKMLEIIVVKVLIGMIMGFAVDLVLRWAKKPEEPLAIHKICARDHCECSGECATCRDNPELTYEHDRILAECTCACDHHEHAHDHRHDDHHGTAQPSHHAGHETHQECECEHHHAHQHTGTHIVKSAVNHTVKVTVFVWVISLVIGALFAVAGEDMLASVLNANPVLSVLVSGLVGLIPNCAASVAIIELYMEGVLNTGAMMAGLLVAAGVGLLVLCRANGNARQNVTIIVALYFMGIAWGFVFLATGITF